jgi:hypothetical protein
MTEQDVLNAVRTRVPPLWDLSDNGVLRFNDTHCPLTILALGVAKSSTDWQKAARVLGISRATARRIVAATDGLHEKGWDFDLTLRRRLLKACGMR